MIDLKDIPVMGDAETVRKIRERNLASPERAAGIRSQEVRRERKWQKSGGAA